MADGTTYNNGKHGALDDLFTRIGEAFGEQVADLVGTARTRTVTIAGFDDSNENALVYIFENTDETLSVPLTLLGIPKGMLTIRPNIGSIATIIFINGDENRPAFVDFAEVDSIEFKRGKTAISWTITPPERDEDGEPIEDETDDEILINVGDSTFSMKEDEVNLIVGGSSIRIDDELIEMNDGTLNGLVIVGKLTQRLNKMQSEIDQIQTNVAGHSHLVATTGSATAQTGQTTSTVYTKVTLTQVQDSDYENKKITQ